MSAFPSVPSENKAAVLSNLASSYIPHPEAPSGRPWTAAWRILEIWMSAISPEDVMEVRGPAEANCLPPLPVAIFLFTSVVPMRRFAPLSLFPSLFFGVFFSAMVPQ